MESIHTENAVFETEAVFRRKLKSYIKHCNKPGEDEKSRRLPNAAGFCRFCEISREGFAKLKSVYPLMYDIAQSTFLDEALNTKMSNSAANMSFLAEFNRSVGEADDEAMGDTVRLITCHDDGDAL
ncbi:MAG: hypothetical protein IJX47_05405 [Clostridia bacterium]|nr:hypothetical protein [Clostridia bacterium]